MKRKNPVPAGVKSTSSAIPGRKTIGAKIIAVSLLSMVLAAAIAATIAILPFVREFRNTAQTQANTGVRYLESVINEKLTDALKAAETASKLKSVSGIIENKGAFDPVYVRKTIEKAALDAVHGDGSKMPEMLTITDSKGIVLSRLHSEKKGDDLSKIRATVQQALEGKTISDFEEGAIVWSASATAPIADWEGKIIGTIVIGYNMSNPSLVDRVKKISNTDVTLFRMDERINTTIMKNGERAVGTKLDPKIASIVLGGKSFTGEADILGIPHITSYSPVNYPPPIRYFKVSV